MTDDDAARLARDLASQVTDRRVLEAIEHLPRELFVPAEARERAYDNAALDIPCGQTISQPLVVARMLEALALRPGDRVLDVGTGSGYHAALLARLAGHVWSIERHAELSQRAAASLAAAGVDDVTLVVGDGAAGHPPAAPYDAINVAAAVATRVPPALEAQLADGGRLIAPVGTDDQRLELIRRHGESLQSTMLEPVRFVPLVSEARAFSVGHSTRSAGELAELLRAAGVQVVADVRTAPSSRRLPHFDRAALERWLPEAGIDYVHVAELGGRRRPEPDSPNGGWEHAAFRGYADHLASAEFARGLARLQGLAGERPTAMMCAEAVWWRCHRRLIADALTVRGWQVLHLGAGHEPTVHELTPFARVQEERRLTYPPPQTALEL